MLPDAAVDSMQQILAKVGCHEFMESLLTKGEVYMNQLCWYRDHDNPAIGDKNEGLAEFFSGDNPTAKLIIGIGSNKLTVPFKDMRIPGPYSDHGVYCMAITRVISATDVLDLNEDGPIIQVLGNNEVRFTIHEDFKPFGDKAVIFRDSVEFVRRLEAAADAAGIPFSHGAVEYVPSTYCGSMGPFKKLPRYKSQREWRFFTEEPLNGPQKLCLGPLEDIAFIADMRMIRPLEQQFHSTDPEDCPT